MTALPYGDARAEQTLREREARYRNLFESMDEGFCVIEVLFNDAGKAVDYIFLETNPAFEKQTGLVNIVGKRVRQIVPHLEEFWFEMYGRVAQTGQPERVELPVSAIDLGWISIHTFRVDAPEQHHVVVLFNDIDERKRREMRTAFLDQIGKDLTRLSDEDEIIQALGARLADYLGLSGCIFADVDEEHGEVTIHHGWTREKVPGPKQTFRLEDYLTEEFAPVARAGETFVVRDVAEDPRVNAKKYASLHIGAFVVAPFHSHVRWTGYVAVTDVKPRDWRSDEIQVLEEVSERLFFRLDRLRAVEALRESEQRQRLMLDLVPALLWSADPQGNVILSPEPWKSYTGQNDEEISNYGWLQAIHPEDLEPTRAAFEHAFATGESLERRQRIRRADGVYRWHLMRHGPVRDEKGVITRWFGAAIDVQDLQEAQEQQAFLLQLTDTLRPLQDARQIQQTAIELIGERLAVNRAGYYEVGDDQDTFFLTARWERGAPPLPERMLITDFGDEIRVGCQTGRTLVARDTERTLCLNPISKLYAQSKFRRGSEFPSSRRVAGSPR